MSLEGGVDAPERVQVLLDAARFLEGGPQDRRAVALREDEFVDVARRGVLRIEAELVEIEDRHDLGARHAGGRMAAARLGRRRERMAAEFLGHFFQGGAVGHGFSWRIVGVFDPVERANIRPGSRISRQNPVRSGPIA
jgi:hypothetical protein